MPGAFTPSSFVTSTRNRDPSVAAPAEGRRTGRARLRSPNRHKTPGARGERSGACPPIRRSPPGEESRKRLRNGTLALQIATIAATEHAESDQRPAHRGGEASEASRDARQERTAAAGYPGSQRASE